MNRNHRRPPIVGVTLVCTAFIVVASGLVIAPRGLLFTLPLVLVCAADGACCIVQRVHGWLTNERSGLPHLLSRMASLRVAPTGLIATTIALAVMTGLRTWRQEYLCSVAHNVVDIEQILAECRRFGADDCALVVRYSPATAYYVALHNMDFPAWTENEQTRRTYIFTDDMLSLEQAWHSGIAGFERYSLARPLRSLSRSILYAADRMPEREETVNAPRVPESRSSG